MSNETIYCDDCDVKNEKVPEYKNLYEMLDRFQYILANDAEKHVDCNEPLYQALSQYNEDRFYDEIMQYNGNPLKRELTKRELAKNGREFTNALNDKERENVYDYLSNLEYPDIYQTFIVDEEGYEILKDYGQIVWYNEEMDLHFWGVTHYGTAWSHVMDSVYPVQNRDCYKKY